LEETEQAEQSLHWICKLIVKLPMFSLDIFPDEFQGIFWSIVVPICIILQELVNLILFISLPYSLNILCVISINAVIFIGFLRIILERELTLKRALIREGTFNWDVDKAVTEYCKSLHKKKK